MKNKIPFILIFSRIPLAIIIALLAWLQPEHTRLMIVVLMVIALLTDVFDGIVARQLGISSERIRTLDSNVDQFFWIVTILAIFGFNVEFLKAHWIWIALIVVLELLAYLISYVKFKRTIATHSLMAKFWTITLLAFLIDLCLNGTSTFVFWICAILGIVSRLEIIAIIVGLKEWATDIPTFLDVKKINRGEPIKRNKLFNG